MPQNMYDTIGETGTCGPNSSYDGDGELFLPRHRYMQSATYTNKNNFKSIKLTIRSSQQQKIQHREEQFLSVICKRSSLPDTVHFRKLKNIIQCNYHNGIKTHWFNTVIRQNPHRPLSLYSLACGCCCYITAGFTATHFNYM